MSLRIPSAVLPLLVASSVSLLAACGGGEERKNVILISVDTLRADFLGCYGWERPTSPAIDALASAGVRFDDVTAASPWTLPSHASMLTGQYPSTHGVKDHEFALTAETLATWFGRAGYQTMAGVNSHNIGNPAYGLVRGFDDTETYKYWFEMNVIDGRPGADTLNRAEEIVDRAIRNLEARDPERNFFFFLHFYDVHTDFTPEPEWRDEFVEPYDGDVRALTNSLVKLRAQETPLEEADIRYLIEMYEAEIRTFDDRIAVLFDYLEESGLDESTIVALTSDHGEEYFEHESLLHGRTYYQELMRIPLLLCGPGVPAGRVVEGPVHVIDVAPTLYALAGVEGPPGMDGIDLTRSWKDASFPPRDRVLFAEADHNIVIDGRDVSDVMRMIRRGHMKLVFNTVTGEKELYDLAADPLEQNDLIDVEVETAASLFEVLQSFMQRSGSAREIEGPDAETQSLLDKLGY